MSLSAIMNTAQSGILAQQTRMVATASNIANASTPGYRRLDTSLSETGGGVYARVTEAPMGANVDLVSETVDLKQAEIGFAANLAVFEAGADMWDMLMSALDSRDRD